MKKVLGVLLFLVIVGAGAGVLAFLVMTKPEPKRKPPADPSVVVQVVEAVATEEKVNINGMGTVIPARAVTVFPQVGGKIVAQSKKLVPGGRFRAGEQLLRIDPRDYNLAIRQQRAAVNKAEMELATERARKSVAEREWSLIQDEVQPTEEGKKLALREIQLETAEAGLASAKSGLERALLSRNRTAINAPFDALVTEEFVDKGQVVGPGTRLATLVDRQRFWVRVSVPVDRLSWINIPGLGSRKGSTARIVQRVGPGESVERVGRVIRLLGDVEPQGKMARVLVEIEDPLGTGDSEGEGLPLLLGAFVSVDIEGPELGNVIELPRRAVRDRNRVWIKRDGKLFIEEVEVVWTTETQAFVKGELAVGEHVVVSRIAAPVAGMSLRLKGEKVADAGVEDAGPAREQPGDEAGQAR